MIVGHIRFLASRTLAPSPSREALEPPAVIVAEPKATELRLSRPVVANAEASSPFAEDSSAFGKASWRAARRADARASSAARLRACCGRGGW